MNHRDALLDAARRCLQERGYARTTARDLVAASHTNLGSIGYHFGSKEALLNQALIAAFDEWVETLLSHTAVGQGPDPIRDSWVAMTEQFADYRPLIVAFAEALAQAERNPSLREQLADCYERWREAIATTVVNAFPKTPEETARSIASLMMAVCDGAMVQWLLDPERAPDGATLFNAAHLAFADHPR
jgi:AcrR family transcriptional regulator